MSLPRRASLVTDLYEALGTTAIHSRMAGTGGMSGGPNYAIRWLYYNLAEHEVLDGPITCAVCGLPTDGGVALDRVLRPTFVDRDLLAKPAGIACAACEWYFNNFSSLRLHHWYVTANEARSLGRDEIWPLLRGHLTCPPGIDRYYLLSQSKKKHIALRACLNVAGSWVLRVNFEEMLVDVDSRFEQLLLNLVRLKRYHTWREIESEYLPLAILAWPNFDDFLRTRAVVQPWLRTSQYYLARYLYSPNLLGEVE